MPRILEFSRKISIFIAEKISLCEGEKEKDLARKTVNSNCRFFDVIFNVHLRIYSMGIG